MTDTPNSRTNTETAADDPRFDSRYLRILQINLNKSEKAQLELLNNDLHKHWDIVLLQEPYTNFYRNIATPKGFRHIYPSKKARKEVDTAVGCRSGIWVSTRLSTNSWYAVEVGGSPDITAIRYTSEGIGSITIFNIYNGCTNHASTEALQDFITDHEDEIYGEGKHVIWAGDFNRHHRMWENEGDQRLLTTQAAIMAEPLILMLSEWGMNMALPRGIRTLKHFVTKAESRPDNVFCTDALLDRLISCDIRTSEQPPYTDHYPIATVFDIQKATNRTTPQLNFKEVDWDEFEKDLQAKFELMQLDANASISSEPAFNERVDILTRIIQDTISAKVPSSKPSSFARRWWNKDLSAMRKTKKKLLREAKRHRALPGHPIHQQLKEHMNKYALAIVEAKKEHWESFLNDADYAVLWTASRYLKDPVGDGTQAGMPPLLEKVGNAEVLHCTNDKKAEVLGKGFFTTPPPPPTDKEIQEAEQYQYPDPLEPSIPITADIVKRHLDRIAPHKAPGLDGIPNVVLKKCANTLAPQLATIYNAVFALDIYHNSWKESITCVLRKPGRPSYQAAKAYRPIALLSTMGKVLSAIVAEDMSQLIEEHNLLPPTHFGGRPNRTTTDALHYLVMKIKQAWRKGLVASVLFLDVEGAFPNAVTSKIIHNLKKRRMPAQYVSMVANMLSGRKTRLRFDDFLSEFIEINNGIGQGCPLSMLLYIIYNADMMEIGQTNSGDDAIGYVDDIALLAVGTDFKETTKSLKRMMVKEGGGLDWAATHNSKFEMSKVAVMHFSRSRAKGKHRSSAPRLVLQGTTISKVEEYKYLGALMDPELRWKAQAERAAKKGMDWVNLFKRLARMRYGMNTDLLRHLYRAVAIPKMTYAADVWYDPPRLPDGKKKRIGSIKALTKLQRVQKAAAVAITGALRASAGDALDVYANLLPIDLQLEMQIERSYIRLCTLTDSHVLSDHIWAAHQNRNNTLDTVHPYPLTVMAHRYGTPPNSVEKIGTCDRPPTYKPVFDSHIDESRIKSIEGEKANTARIRIYTDGSAIDGKVGAAALLYINNKEDPRQILHYHLGPKKLYSTYDAEWVGAVMAVRMLTNSEDDSVGQETATIFVDNQSVIKSSRTTKPGPAQYLMKALHDLADRLRHIGDAKSKFTLRWISAHSDVDRNEKVDLEAKKAARGESSNPSDLPEVLRQTLPFSKSALVQNAKSEAKSNWKERWGHSKRAQRYYSLDEQFPPKRFREVAQGTTRSLACALTQIRTGHIPLNQWLHKRKLADTDKCTQCDDGKPESIHHYLFACKKFKRQRQKMDKAHKSAKRNLRKIFASSKYTGILLRYVKDTGRLTFAPQEQLVNRRQREPG